MADSSNPISRAGAWLFERTHAAAVARFRGVPGPRPVFPLGNLGDFTGAKPWEVLGRYVRAHGGGPLVVWWSGGEPVVTPATPEAAREVLTREDDFYKDAPRRALTPLLTEVDPLLANPPAWEAVRARSLFALPGMRDWLDAQLPRFAGRVRGRLRALADAPAEDARLVLREVTFDVFTEMAVGDDLDDGAYDDVMTMARAGDARLRALRSVPEEVDDAPFLRARDALRERFVAAVADARARGCRGRTDLVAHALERGTALSDAELAAALANLYFTGLFTTSSALLGTLWALTNHADARRAVRESVRALGGGPWTAGGLAAVGPLDAAIREATRLFPPTPVCVRNSARDREVTLGGVALPPDTRVFLSSYALHRDPRVWDEPDAFVMARWTDARRAEIPYGDGRFWPFGIGRRACAGQEIALAFVRAAVAVAVGEADARVGEGAAMAGDGFFASFSPAGLSLIVPA